MLSENISAVTDADFDSVIASKTPVLVDFWAEWCGPCKAIAPVLEQIADEQSGRVRIVKLDVDAYPSARKRFEVQGIPTLILFQEGELMRIVGSQTKARILENLLPVL